MKHSFEPETDRPVKPAHVPIMTMGEIVEAESPSNDIMVLMRSWQERAFNCRDEAQNFKGEPEVFQKMMARAATYDVCADELKIWIARAIDKAL